MNSLDIQIEYLLEFLSEYRPHSVEMQFHDILRKEGPPYNQEEVDFIKAIITTNITNPKGTKIWPNTHKETNNTKPNQKIR